MMFSTCFEPSVSSSGRLLYIQVKYIVQASVHAIFHVQNSLYRMYTCKQIIPHTYICVYIYIYPISQQMHCSDSLLTSYSSYMFRRMYVIIHSAVTIATPHHRCIYCHPDKAQLLTRQCNQCYSDFTIGYFEGFINYSHWMYRLFDIYYTAIRTLTLRVLMSYIYGAAATASKWQMGFNSVFKGL
jgi:hypothetical protein